MARNNRSRRVPDSLTPEIAREYYPRKVRLLQNVMPARSS